MNTTLSKIRPGHHVVVSGIKESAIKPKLMEMGLIIGKEITVLFKAPLGDPIAIDINGYILSLRLNEADLVDVRETK